MKTPFWKIIEIIILSITAFLLLLGSILTKLTLTELLIAYAISFFVFFLDFLHAKATGKSVTGRNLMQVKAKFSNSTPKRHIFIYKLYIVVLIITLIIVTASTLFLLLR